MIDEECSPKISSFFALVVIRSGSNHPEGALGLVRGRGLEPNVLLPEKRHFPKIEGRARYGDCEDELNAELHEER